MIDIQEKKKKIISFLENNGPSLPVRIAKAIQMDPVFASAIVSELLGTKQVKTSNMKIGSSPLYLLPGQEQKLEEYTENLKSIENKAYQKLKENKILKDEDEEPAIRVALRNIKDFATPFKFQEKIMWKYTFTPEEEINKLLSPPKEEKPEVIPKAWEIKKEEIKKAKEESRKVKGSTPTNEAPQHLQTKHPNTFDIKDINKQAKENFQTNAKQQADKHETTNTPSIENIFEKEEQTSDEANKHEANEKSFLEQIEEFLENKNTKIISIEEVDKKKVIAKTESESKEALLFAFNKQRVNESEIMTCYKQAKKSNLPYHIIILGDLTKKMNDTINAYKKLIKVEKL